MFSGILFRWMPDALCTCDYLSVCSSKNFLMTKSIASFWEDFHFSKPTLLKKASEFCCEQPKNTLRGHTETHCEDLQKHDEKTLETFCRNRSKHCGEPPKHAAGSLQTCRRHPPAVTLHTRSWYLPSALREAPKAFVVSKIWRKLLRKNSRGQKTDISTPHWQLCVYPPDPL